MVTGMQMAMRLLFATVVGAIIGFERQAKGHPLGIRTNVLVCVSATTIMMLSKAMLAETYQLYGMIADPRLAQQVITGIGFLGAGTIVHSDSNIKGLTTAATVWSVGCIGLVIGFGWYSLALFTTVLVFLALFVMDHLSKRIDRKSQTYHISVILSQDSKLFFDVLEYLRGWEVSIDHAEAVVEGEGDAAFIEFHVKGMELAQTLINNLKRKEGIHTIKFR
ncbi:MAG: MgtC/SapB family protein [Oscillospiraceae bacterium]|nr:MgtC/SapB family protein [Oscillospiraceae bacterium]MBQ6850630.1 MgtC/SapB family protein [Oscillospiraceae bacterium]